MSNPGVISLASNQKFGLKIEDNIGEAIHLHYENIRLDLTVEEFENLSDCMHSVIDELVSVEGFSSYNINPENLAEISPFLYKLKKAEKDEVYLKDILVSKESGKYLPLNKIKNTSNSDTEDVLQNEQIVLFGNKNIAICGQVYCKKLYNIKGNVKISVTRLFFDKSVRIKDIQKKQLKISLIKKIIKIIKWIIRKIR